MTTNVTVVIEADEWYPVYSVSEVNANSTAWENEHTYVLSAKALKDYRKVEDAFQEWQNRLHDLTEGRRLAEEAVRRNAAYEAKQAAVKAKAAAKAERRRVADATNDGYGGTWQQGY